MRHQAAPALLLLIAGGLSGPVHAGLESLFSPMGLGNPYTAAGNPLAGILGTGYPFGNPYGGYYGNPLGGIGGTPGLGTLGAVPALLGSPLGMGAGNLMYPGLQMAPNMLSHHHLHSMANPYLGGPFAGNPYLQTSMPLPFAPPAFSPSMPVPPSLGQPYGGRAPGMPVNRVAPAPATSINLPFALPTPASPAQATRSAPQSTAAAQPWPFQPAGAMTAPQAPAAPPTPPAPTGRFPFPLPIPPAPDQPATASPTTAATPQPQSQTAPTATPGTPPSVGSLGPVGHSPTLVPLPPVADKPTAASPAKPSPAAPAAPPQAQTTPPTAPLPFDPTPWFRWLFAPARQ